MRKLAAYSALRVLTGLMMSALSPMPGLNVHLLIALCRVKNKLRSGDYIVPGDQWPVLLYKDHIYDSEDPWNGFLRSVILISVRTCNVASAVC